MTIGESILKDVSVSITSEATTREALIRAMSTAMDSFTDADTGKVKFHCSLTCMSEELSVFLGQNDVKFLSLLTAWYDSRDEWKYETKGSGKDHLSGVCFNLLGATAPDWLRSILPDEAIGGGFTSRVIFVVEEKKGKTVAESHYTKAHEELRKQLVKDLEQIRIISGEYTFDAKANAAYIAWYKEQETLIEKGEPPIDDPRFAGYCERRGTHVRKLSMLLTASRTSKRVIMLSDFERALLVLKAVEVKMSKTFGGLGRAQYSEVTEQVLEYIVACKKVKRSTLMSKFYRDVDPPTLKIIEEVLSQMRVVKVKIDGKDVIYEYIG